MGGGGARDEAVRTREKVRIRIAAAVLAIAAAATVLVAGLIWRQEAIGQLPLWVAATSAAIILARLFTGHLALSLAAVFGPLGGMVWLIALGERLHLSPPSQPEVFSFGLAVSFLALDTFLDRVMGDTSRTSPAAAIVRGSAAPVLSALAVAAVISAATFQFSHAGIAAAWDLLQLSLVSVSSIGVVAALGTLAHLDESFIASSNRMREARTVWTWPLSRLATRRWALSISGVALVVLVLGGFGAAPLEFRITIALSLLVLCMFLSAWLFTRNWRISIGTGAGFLIASLLGLWGWKQSGGYGPFPPPGWSEGCCVAVLMLAAVGFRTTAIEAERSESIRLVLAVENISGAIGYAALGALVTTVLSPGAAPVFVTLVIAGVFCSLVFTPSVSATLEAAVPRRRTVVELYGQK